jgi:isocitrate/isopropylmalate dehydrogenase
MDLRNDLAAALAGSIGVAPSSNLDPTRKYPSLFQPVYGSAFDITEKGVANSVATVWNGAGLLRWFGESKAVVRMMDCVERVCAAGIRTEGHGRSASTKEVIEAVCREAEGLAQ